MGVCLGLWVGARWVLGVRCSVKIFTSVLVRVFRGLLQRVVNRAI